MQRLLIILTCTFFSFCVYSQDKKTDDILEEGKLLFRLEKGSWYGTDQLLENYQSKLDSLRGYVTYEDKDHTIHTVFFNRYDSTEVLLHFQFDSLPIPKPIKIAIESRKAKPKEADLYELRRKTEQAVINNEDNYFKFYENTSYNFIPIIRGNRKEVFILTASQLSGVLFLGNDYKLTYNKKNELKQKQRLHNLLLSFPFQSEEEGKKMVSTISSSVLSDYITSTSICTLLLYKNYLGWNQHIVISEKYVSIFNIENETLFAMKRDAWEKIQNSNSNQE